MERLTAQKSANFDDFTDMIKRMLDAAWGKNWGTFMQRFPNGRDPSNVDLPIITYHCKRKRPGIYGKGTQEIKPRFREYYTPSQQPGERPIKVNVYSQTFDYEVVFDIWAETNQQADELANQFEDFMMTYAGYFLSQGVQQMVFLEASDTTDDVSLKDNVVVRNYKYLVRLEKHVEVPISVIQEVIGAVTAYTDSDAPNNSINEESISFKIKKGGNTQ